MGKRFCTAAVCLILLAGSLVGQQWTDWSPTSDSSGIQFRSQAFANAKACYIEFKDPQQGRGNTTFDAAVDYRSLDLNADNEPIAKTETEHIVVPPSRNGSARISNCSSVTDARVSLIQRH